MASNGSGRSFSTAELEELEAMEKLISRKEAEKKILSKSILKLSSSYKVTDFNCFKNFNSDFIYSISLSDGKNEAYVMMNAADGEILSFSRFDKSNGE